MKKAISLYLSLNHCFKYIQTRIVALESHIQSLRDKLLIEPKKVIGEAPRLLQRVYDITYDMDNAVTKARV